MITLGIDPGLSGGVAALDVGGRLLLAERMPIARGQVATVDVIALRELLQAALGPDLRRLFAYVERAQSMPRQGVASTFAYGVAFGSLLGALSAFEVGHVLVSSAVWKRACGLDSDKRRSLAMAKQLWPQLAQLKRTDDGVAEAALIARWGWQRDCGAALAEAVRQREAERVGL